MSEQEYDNEKRGVLFRNEEKQKETSPDFKGSVTVEGVEYWLSAWVQQSRKGRKYFSLSLQEKQEAHDRGIQQAKDAVGDDAHQPPSGQFDDDIPF